jgi:hypothetical protein
MPLSRLTRLIDLLSAERATAYAFASMVVGCFIIFYSFAKAPNEISGSIDFPAFYNAGRILNEYPQGSLYNQELQHRLYLEIVPLAAPEGVNRYFAYTPFFALFFAPLALLPHSWAFVLWIVISLGLFGAGFRFAWKAAALPIVYRRAGFLIALSFLPFYAWCLLMGQTSAFGFFFLALAIYLDRKNPFLGGCALAMLLYKPPLLILLIPMLVVTRRWRTLGGFCLGTLTLGLISLAVIGPSGVHSYLEMLKTFSQIKSAGQPTFLEVDAFSFFLPLVGRRIAILLVIAIAAAVLPFLITAWRRRPETSWALAITWTLILNFYILIYDSTLIILSVLVFVSLLWPSGLPRSLRWLLVLLFLVPWPEADITQRFGLQILTIVVAAFGSYQIVTVRRILRNPTGSLSRYPQ